MANDNLYLGASSIVSSMPNINGSSLLWKTELKFVWQSNLGSLFKAIRPCKWKALSHLGMNEWNIMFWALSSFQTLFYLQPCLNSIRKFTSGIVLMFLFQPHRTGHLAVEGGRTLFSLYSSQKKKKKIHKSESVCMKPEFNAFIVRCWALRSS